MYDLNRRNEMGSEIEKKEECFCKSKYFKKFLTVATGSFVGVYCAICLFVALHRPPMMHPMMHSEAMMPHNPMTCNCPCHHKEMKKKMKYKNFEKNRYSPAEQKPEIDD